MSNRTLLANKIPVELARVNGALAIVLPDEVARALNAREGGPMYLSRAQVGWQLDSGEATHDEQMSAAREVMDQYRDALAILAK